MIDPDGVKPLEFNVVVELLPTEEKAGSILLPDEVKDRNQRGTTVGRVVSVADRAFSDPEMFGPDDRCVPGDVVIVGKYTGAPLARGNADANTTFRVVKDKDIFAKVMEAAHV
ncbi:MAG: hypothetical protein ACPGVG_14220 [Mycobacterium sp.]